MPGFECPRLGQRAGMSPERAPIHRAGILNLVATVEAIEDPRGWALSVRGWTITRCYIDPSGFGLLADGGTGEILDVYIEGHFTLREAGHEESFRAGDGATRLAPLLTLMGRELNEVRVSRNSDLTVIFTDGSTLSAAPESDYEAWNLEVGRVMFICTPGGGGPSGRWD
jgi:hypothetical protein